MRTLLCSLALVGCGSVPVTPSFDASVQDAADDVWCLVHFDQLMMCSDAGILPGPCGDAPGTTFHSDAGFAVGCTTIQDDRRYFDPDAGECVTPVYTCVGTPTAHWEPSFTNAGVP